MLEVMFKKCDACGFYNLDDAKFCENCGISLEKTIDATGTSTINQKLSDKTGNRNPEENINKPTSADRKKRNELIVIGLLLIVPVISLFTVNQFLAFFYGIMCMIAAYIRCFTKVKELGYLGLKRIKGGKILGIITIPSLLLGAIGYILEVPALAALLLIGFVAGVAYAIVINIRRAERELMFKKPDKIFIAMNLIALFCFFFASAK